MRNILIIILWALLLACGIFAYSVYRHADQAEQALETSKSELSALQGETLRLEQKLEAGADTNKQLKASLQALESELRASREAQEQSMTRSNNLLGEVERLNEALAAKEGKLAALEAQYSQKTAAAAQTLSQKNRLFADLQRANEDLAAQMDSANATIKSLQAKEKLLTLRLAEEKQAKQETRALLDGLNRSESYLQTQLTGALRSNNEAAARSQKLVEDLDAARQQIKELQTRLSENTAALDKLRGEKQSVLTQADRIKTTYEALVSGLKEDIDKKQATIEAFEDKIRVRFVDRVLFGSGQSTVTAQGRASLKNVAAALADMPDYTIRVSGHTDNVPISRDYRSKYPTNWELSAARAAAVVRYFVEELGWDGSRLEAIGHAYFQPVAANDTEEGRAQNRRVEIAVLPGK